MNTQTIQTYGPCHESFMPPSLSSAGAPKSKARAMECTRVYDDL